MKAMTISDAVKLTKCQPAPAISIYLKTDHTDQDGLGKMRANLARLYKSVESMVIRTYDSRAGKRVLEPLKVALQGLRLSPSKGGLAIYHNERFTGVVQIPTPVSDLAVAAETFHLKPMLRCAQLRKSYYILALKRRYAELYLVTADEIKKCESIEIPQRIALEGQRDEHRTWFKIGLRVRRQKHLQEAMVTLNRLLGTHWQGERLPLVLAGNKHDQDAFRKACSYAYILKLGLIGNVEYMDKERLSMLVGQLMEPYFSHGDSLAVKAFRKAEAAGLGSKHLVEIAAAASRGQIQSLLIAEDRHIWGRFDRDSGAVEVLKEKQDAVSDDLLDDIAELTLIKGGKVTVLPSSQMPKGAVIAAVFRWAHTPEEGQVRVG